MTSAETISTICQRTDTVLLAFSCGKDSLGCWLELRKHFRRIVPFYMYLVPELEFIERSLAYYEQFFGCRIARYPHPSLYRMLRNQVFQPPEHRLTIEAAQLPIFDYRAVYGMVREKEGLPDECYAASGVRAVDSPYRMIAIKRYGPINHKAKQFYPIWDWNKERLLAEIQQSKALLPVDYRLFGRSFDGLDFRFLDGIKRHFPRDYQRILDYFPLADLELKRREYATAG